MLLKQTIPSAPSISSKFPESSPTYEFVSITNRVSIHRVYNVLNFYSHKAKCDVEALLTLVPAMVGGDFIFRGSLEPGRFSL